MKSSLIGACAALALASAIALPAAGQSQMHGKDGHAMHGDMAGVKVTEVWARATPGKTPNGGAYLTIANRGKTADRLVSASADVADKAEIHTHIDDNGVMRMREVEGGVEVPAGGTVTFKPGGMHVMLLGLHNPLQEGQTFPLTLTFEKAGDTTVTVNVRKIGAMEPGGHQGHGGHMAR